MKKLAFILLCLLYSTNVFSFGLESPGPNEEECVFRDGLQTVERISHQCSTSRESANICFGYNSQLIDNPDNSLRTYSTAHNPGSTIASCEDEFCSSDGEGTDYIETPRFYYPETQSNVSTCSTDLNVNWNQEVTIYQTEYNKISMNSQSKLHIRPYSRISKINEIHTGWSTSLDFSGSDFIIGKLETNSKNNISIVASNKIKIDTFSIAGGTSSSHNKIYLKADEIEIHDFNVNAYTDVTIEPYTEGEKVIVKIYRFSFSAGDIFNFAPGYYYIKSFETGGGGTDESPIFNITGTERLDFYILDDVSLTSAIYFNAEGTEKFKDPSRLFIYCGGKLELHDKTTISGYIYSKDSIYFRSATYLKGAAAAEKWIELGTNSKVYADLSAWGDICPCRGREFTRNSPTADDNYVVYASFEYCEDYSDFGPGHLRKVEVYDNESLEKTDTIVFDAYEKLEEKISQEKECKRSCQTEVCKIECELSSASRKIFTGLPIFERSDREGNFFNFNRAVEWPSGSGEKLTFRVFAKLPINKLTEPILRYGFIFGFSPFAGVEDPNFDSDMARLKSLGAINHSQPAIVGEPPLKPEWFYYVESSCSVLDSIVDSHSGAIPCSEAESYLAFRERVKNRKKVIYVGSDDGMLHCFDYETGEELWAYIPYHFLLEKKFQNQTAFVDSSPTVGDAMIRNAFPEIDLSYNQAVNFNLVHHFLNNTWRTLLIIGEGSGGHYYSILDITDPENPFPIAEFTHSKMGGTWSSASLSRVCTRWNQDHTLCENTEWTTFLTSGYSGESGSNQGQTIYAVSLNSRECSPFPFLGDVQTCFPLAFKWEFDVGGADVDNNIPGIPASVDAYKYIKTGENAQEIVGKDGYYDRVFVGDLLGRLWEFNTVSDTSYADNPNGENVPLIDLRAYSDWRGDFILGSALDQGSHPIYASPSIYIVDPNESKKDLLGRNESHILVTFGTGGADWVSQDINQYFIVADATDKKYDLNAPESCQNQCTMWEGCSYLPGELSCICTNSYLPVSGVKKSCQRYKQFEEDSCASNAVYTGAGRILGIVQLGSGERIWSKPINFKGVSYFTTVTGTVENLNPNQPGTGYLYRVDLIDLITRGRCKYDTVDCDFYETCSDSDSNSIINFDSERIDRVEIGKTRGSVYVKNGLLHVLVNTNEGIQEKAYGSPIRSSSDSATFWTLLNYEKKIAQGIK